MSDLEFWKDLGNIFDAVKDYQKKNVEFNNRFINPWIKLGNIFDKDDRKKQAVLAHRHAVEIDPDNSRKWTDLGDALFNAAEYDDAISAYETAFQLDPLDGLPLCNQAYALVAQGRTQDALPLYLASIELFEGNKEKAMAWDRLGNAFRKLNDYESAFQAFQKADQLDGENKGFHDIAEQAVEDSQPVIVVAEAPAESLAFDVANVTDEVEGSDVSEVQETVDTLNSDVANASDVSEVQEPVIESITEEAVETLTSDVATVSDEFEGSNVSDAQEPAEVEALVEVAETNLADAQEPVTAAEQPAEAETPIEPTAVEPVVAEEEPIAETESALVDVELVQPAQAVQDETISNTTSLALDSVQTFTEIPEQAEAFELQTVEVESNVEVEELLPVEVEAEVASTSAAQDEDVHPFDIKSNEAAYEEFLKDSEPAKNAEPEMPAMQVSADGEVSIEMDVRNAHVWNELGNAYLNCGAFDDAASAYSKSIELDRTFAWPYFNLAQAYVQKGRFVESTVLYRHSIELFEREKDKAAAWDRLGNVYRRLNDYNNAISAYQTADDLDPETAMLSMRSRFGLMGAAQSEKKIALEEAVK